MLPKFKIKKKTKNENRGPNPNRNRSVLCSFIDGEKDIEVLAVRNLGSCSLSLSIQYIFGGTPR